MKYTTGWITIFLRFLALDSLWLWLFLKRASILNHLIQLYIDGFLPHFSCHIVTFIFSVFSQPLLLAVHPQTRVKVLFPPSSVAHFGAIKRKWGQQGAKQHHENTRKRQKSIVRFPVRYHSWSYLMNAKFDKGNVIFGGKKKKKKMTRLSGSRSEKFGEIHNACQSNISWIHRDALQHPPPTPFRAPCRDMIWSRGSLTIAGKDRCVVPALPMPLTFLLWRCSTGAPVRKEVEFAESGVIGCWDGVQWAALLLERTPRFVSVRVTFMGLHESGGAVFGVRGWECPEVLRLLVPSLYCGRTIKCIHGGHVAVWAAGLGTHAFKKKKVKNSLSLSLSLSPSLFEKGSCTYTRTHVRAHTHTPLPYNSHARTHPSMGLQQLALVIGPLRTFSRNTVVEQTTPLRSEDEEEKRRDSMRMTSRRWVLCRVPVTRTRRDPY